MADYNIYETDKGGMDKLMSLLSNTHEFIELSSGEGKTHYAIVPKDKIGEYNHQTGDGAVGTLTFTEAKGTHGVSYMSLGTNDEGLQATLEGENFRARPMPKDPYTANLERLAEAFLSLREEGFGVKIPDIRGNTLGLSLGRLHEYSIRSIISKSQGDRYALDATQFENFQNGLNAGAVEGQPGYAVEFSAALYQPGDYQRGRILAPDGTQIAEIRKYPGNNAFNPDKNPRYEISAVSPDTRVSDVLSALKITPGGSAIQIDLAGALKRQDQREKGIAGR